MGGGAMLSVTTRVPPTPSRLGGRWWRILQPYILWVPCTDREWRFHVCLARLSFMVDFRRAHGKTGRRLGVRGGQLPVLHRRSGTTGPNSEGGGVAQEDWPVLAAQSSEWDGGWRNRRCLIRRSRILRGPRRLWLPTLTLIWCLCRVIGRPHPSRCMRRFSSTPHEAPPSSWPPPRPQATARPAQVREARLSRAP